MYKAGPMARKPYVALLITAFGSFVDKHKLVHIKKRISAHKILKLKFKEKNQEIRVRFKLKIIFLEITTFLRRKSRNQRQ